MYPAATSFYFLTRNVEGSSFLHPWQYLLFSIFWIIAIPVFVKWYLMVLICIFSSDKWYGTSFDVLIDHMYIFFEDIYNEVYCSFLLLSCFFVYFLLNYGSLLNILDSKLLLHIWVADVFSQSVGCLFNILMNIWYLKALSFDEPEFICLLLIMLLMSYLKIHCQI